MEQAHVHVPQVLMAQIARAHVIVTVAPVMMVQTAQVLVVVVPLVLTVQIVREPVTARMAQAVMMA